MKRFRPIVLAVIIGSLFSLFLFKEVEMKTIDIDYNRVAIQIGVFKDLENAEKMKTSHGGEVFKDNDVYRVYYAILRSDDNIKFITDYLNNNGISYYLKDIKVEDKVSKKSDEFETLMSKTSDASKLKVNRELLNIYKEVV